MKRWSLILCAIAFGASISSPAEASFSVIRWTSGFCQIWDNSIPTVPWPGDWLTVSKSYPTLGGAAAAKSRLLSQGKCRF
jgi:hypothetical protein